MSIYEYNQEYVRKSLFEDGVETGYNSGYDSGQKDGNVKGDSRRLLQSLGITFEEYERAKQLVSGNH